MKTATATFGTQAFEQAIERASAFSSALAAQASDAARAGGALIEETVKGGERVLAELRGERTLDKRLERAGTVAQGEAVRIGNAMAASTGTLWNAWLGRCGTLSAAQ